MPKLGDFRTIGDGDVLEVMTSRHWTSIPKPAAAHIYELHAILERVRIYLKRPTDLTNRIDFALAKLSVEAIEQAERGWKDVTEIVHPKPSDACEMVRCEQCDNYFDARDKRAFLPSEPNGWYCPLCAYRRLHGDKQWAVWNSCNGIFECRVRRHEAEALINGRDYHRESESTVPVRVYIEPEDEWHMRAWSENGWEDSQGIRRTPWKDEPQGPVTGVSCANNVKGDGR